MCIIGTFSIIAHGDEESEQPVSRDDELVDRLAYRDHITSDASLPTRISLEVISLLSSCDLKWSILDSTDVTMLTVLA